MSALTKHNAIMDHFKAEGTPVHTVESLEPGNYRVSFADETVADFRVVFDPDTGEVLDAENFNQVI